MPFTRAVRLLVRTDLRLERRAPQLALAMGLFAAVAQVVLHYGADIPQPPVAVTVVVWVTLLLATLLAVARVFNAERDEGLLDALVLAPIPRTAIWAAKAIAITALLLLMEVVAVPLAYLFLPADAPVPTCGCCSRAARGRRRTRRARRARGGGGLRGTRPRGHGAAALPARRRTAPDRRAGVQRERREGRSVVRPLALVLTYDAIVGLLAYAVCEHALTD